MKINDNKINKSNHKLYLNVNGVLHIIFIQIITILYSKSRVGGFSKYEMLRYIID